MAVMKDVAELAGVSVTTVSFVLNGVAKQHKVADTTVKRVWEAARILGYRLSSDSCPAMENIRERTVSILLPADYDEENILPFAREAIRQMLTGKEDVSIRMLPFYSGKLLRRLEIMDWDLPRPVLAIIDGEEDRLTLEKAERKYPVVTVNQSVPRYASVECVADSVLEQTVELIRVKKYQRVIAVIGNGKRRLSDPVFDRLLRECGKAGISLKGTDRIVVDNSLQGGAIAARRILNDKERPDLVLIMNTTLTFGMISLLARNGVFIPKDMECLCIGLESELDYIQNYIPSLSMIAVPIEEMSRLALQSAVTIAENPLSQKNHAKCVASLVLNESFTI